MSTDKSLYRVWPDGWVQDASEEPHSWRSDDFMLLAAEDEDAALAEFMRLACHLARYLERDYRTHITPSEAARELRRLYADNVTLQAGYDAARMEIEHLRGVTKSKLLAQPVAWMVYLPSIDTQHLYYSQEDVGYVDDVTNHADAEVTPLYEMAAPKAEVAPAGEYPPPPPEVFQGDALNSNARAESDYYNADQMRAYADATCAMRAQAAPVAQGDAWRDLLWQIADALECTPCTADEVPPKVLTIAEEAARYRWLRCSGQGRQRAVFLDSKTVDELDAAIDAARAQAKEGGAHA